MIITKPRLIKVLRNYCLSGIGNMTVRDLNYLDGAMSKINYSEQAMIELRYWGKCPSNKIDKIHGKKSGWAKKEIDRIINKICQ